LTNEEQVTWEVLKDPDLSARNCIFVSMANDLQCWHENLPDATSMIQNLRDLYGKHSQTTWYEISKKLFWARIIEWYNIGDHVINMINWNGQLDILNFPMDPYFRIDLILQLLLDSFSSFINYFYMNKIECSLSEFLNMLTT